MNSAIRLQPSRALAMRLVPRPDDPAARRQAPGPADRRPSGAPARILHPPRHPGIDPGTDRRAHPEDRRRSHHATPAAASAKGGRRAPANAANLGGMNDHETGRPRDQSKPAGHAAGPYGRRPLRQSLDMVVQLTGRLRGFLPFEPAGSLRALRCARGRGRGPDRARRSRRRTPRGRNGGRGGPAPPSPWDRRWPVPPAMRDSARRKGTAARCAHPALPAGREARPDFRRARPGPAGASAASWPVSGSLPGFTSAQTTATSAVTAS